MTKEELAAKLNWREYREEMTDSEEADAEDNWLIVVFWASDDLMEFRWKISDEVWVFDWGEAYIINETLVNNDADPFGDVEEMMDFLESYWVDVSSNTIEALFWSERATWRYQTEIPHATFKIMEDDDVYCIGIVFDVSDLK